MAEKHVAKYSKIVTMFISHSYKKAQHKIRCLKHFNVITEHMPA